MALIGAQSSEAAWCCMEEAQPSPCPPNAVRSEDETGGGGPRSPRLCGTCPMLRGRCGSGAPGGFMGSSVGVGRDLPVSQGRNPL